MAVYSIAPLMALYSERFASNAKSGRYSMLLWNVLSVQRQCHSGKRCAAVCDAGKAKMVDFDPFVPQPKMSYKDGYQKQYFVLSSFQEGAKQLLDYCLSITDPEVVKEHMNSLDKTG